MATSSSPLQAFSNPLGSAITGVGLALLEIVRLAQALAAGHGVDVMISLTHSKGMAGAVALR